MGNVLLFNVKEPLQATFLPNVPLGKNINGLPLYVSPSS